MHFIIKNLLLCILKTAIKKYKSKRNLFNDEITLYYSDIKCINIIRYHKKNHINNDHLFLKISKYIKFNTSDRLCNIIIKKYSHDTDLYKYILHNRNLKYINMLIEYFTKQLEFLENELTENMNDHYKINDSQFHYYDTLEIYLTKSYYLNYDLLTDFIMHHYNTKNKNILKFIKNLNDMIIHKDLIFDGYLLLYKQFNKLDDYNYNDLVRCASLNNFQNREPFLKYRMIDYKWYEEFYKKF